MAAITRLKLPEDVFNIVVDIQTERQKKTGRHRTFQEVIYYIIREYKKVREINP